MASRGWAAAPGGIVVGMPRAILEEDLDEFLTRDIRQPIDRLITWGVVILAVAMGVGYQLLPRMDAIAQSVTRWARKVTSASASLRS